MEHSAKFDKLFQYYQIGSWTIAMLKNAVVKNWITEEEFTEITGEPYNE